MSKKMPKEQMALVHALIDDAKTRLTSAKHNHENPQGIYDHARAIAKSDAAKGYAVAADMMHFKMMKMMKKEGATWRTHLDLDCWGRRALGESAKGPAVRSIRNGRNKCPGRGSRSSQCLESFG